MATKKDVLMAQFYEQCQQNGYTDMSDAGQSLKAKVIASDLKLNYGDISSFYKKAKQCYDELKTQEAAEEEKQRELREQAAALAEKQAVDGQLVVTVTDGKNKSNSNNTICVFLRPDNTIYSTYNGGRKIEGAPVLKLCKGGVLSSTYHPSKAVYTGATVGGVTTGGVHYTQAGYTQKVSNTGKGYIEINVGSSSFTVNYVEMSNYTCKRFKRDAEFKARVRNGAIKCYQNDVFADEIEKFAITRSANSMEAMDRLSMAVDARRLSYQECAAIESVLRKVVRCEFPPSDNEIYNRALELSKAATSDKLKKSYEDFELISDYKDAAEKAREIKARYEDVLQTEKERAVLAKEKKSKTTKIIAAVLIVALAAVLIVPKVLENKALKETYSEAEALMESGEYEAAIDKFNQLGDYNAEVVKELKAEAERAKAYEEAEAFFVKKDYQAAAAAFALLENYKESAEKYSEATYLLALELLEKGEDTEAYKNFALVSDYKDAAAYMEDFVAIPVTIELETTSFIGKPHYYRFSYSEDLKMNGAYREAYGENYPNYVFDENGVLIKGQMREGQDEVTFTYGKDGKVTRSKAPGYLKNIYDNNGNKIAYYDKDNKLVEYSEIKVDENNHRIVESYTLDNMYDENGALYCVWQEMNNFQSRALFEYGYFYFPEGEVDEALIWKNIHMIAEEIWY